MELVSKKSILTTIPFTVEELQLKIGGKELDRPYHRLTTRDWVNVLPITIDRKAVLIRQPRAGVIKSVLECPGGVIDPHEKDPTLAAARELEEETGYASQRLLPLATLNPNPAIMTNRCHFFLALGCVPATTRQHFPDADERIEVVLTDVAELEMMVRTGQIDHALCALCIMLAGKYL